MFSYLNPILRIGFEKFAAKAADVGLDGALVTDLEVMGTYRRDRADIVPAGMPRAVVRAAALADVSATMSWANRHGVAVVPRGAGTGLSGGANAIDGCIVLSLERLTVIREVSRDGQYAVAESGEINADNGRAAAAGGRPRSPAGLPRPPSRC